LRAIDTALSTDVSNSLTPVRRLIGAELADRAVRDTVLAPVALLCAPRGDGFEQTLFPRAALSRLWKGLKAIEPSATGAVAETIALTPDDPALPDVCDRLCLAAAAALKEGASAMAPAIAVLQDRAAGSAAELAAFLELAPLARSAFRRLPVWLRLMSDEHAAAVRLLFKDAEAAAPDSAPLLLELLLAQSDEPWTLLRIVSAVTHHASDRYLASSEMAGFCERVLADAERNIGVLRQFDPDGGDPAAQTATDALAAAINEILEFEESLDLNKEGPWGRRIAKMRQTLSGSAEGHLKKAAKAVGEAMPLRQVRLGGVSLRWEPDVEHLPDPVRLRRALGFLAFFGRSRASSGQGGYGSVRARAAEEISHRLDSYIEDLLGMIHAGDVQSLDHARAYLEAAADMIGLVQDAKAAQIARRRAASVLEAPIRPG
jgi:hypothetical protein